MESKQSEEFLKDQAEIWQLMFGFADSMALKCVVELRIPDIIHSHNKPITLSQIISCIETPSNSPDITCLSRIMRLLIRRNIFTTHQSINDGETLYDISSKAKWLLRDNKLNIVPMLLMENHPWLMAPWHCLSQCVKENGSVAFVNAHERNIWDFASATPEFNKIFNDGMECTSKIATSAILTGYKGGFVNIKSLVDVGGGTGRLISEIVKAQPHIVGINFDLPHVIATAPIYDRVSNIGGDMFQSVPTADAVIMKWIMHDWSDEDCVKILTNVRKSIPSKTGKLIIVEVVLKPDGNDVFDDVGVVLDLLMIAHTAGGRERTEVEWKSVLEQGGFRRFNIVKIPALPSIIEAYPEKIIEGGRNSKVVCFFGKWIDASSKYLVRHIAELLSRAWDITLVHQYREANVLADGMTKLADANSRGRCIASLCPRPLEVVLVADAAGSKLCNTQHVSSVL